jgi:hypothetical protein
MEFSLQDIGSGGGWSGVSESFGGNGDTGNNGVISALENIGVNFAAGAATVGLGALGRSAGVSSAYTNPAAVAYNSALLTRRPGTVSPVGAALGVSGNTLVFAGVFLIGGLLVLAAFRRKG